MEQPCGVCTGKRALSIGLPSNNDAEERRFSLTPEAVAVLVDKGLCVRIQAGAAAPIHYSDDDYLRAGAEIASRDETLQCDIVASMPALRESDIRTMRKGSMLLTLYNSYSGNVKALQAPFSYTQLTLPTNSLV